MHDQDHLVRLRKIIKVSEGMEISQLAAMLDMDEKQVLKQLVDWAEQFDFTIRGKDLDFNKDTDDSFVDAIDKEYASWDDKAKHKDGKA